MEIKEWVEKAIKLRNMTGLDIELDFNHYVKFEVPMLDIKKFVLSLEEMGYVKYLITIEDFLTIHFNEEAAELFQEIL